MISKKNSNVHTTNEQNKWLGPKKNTKQLTESNGRARATSISIVDSNAMRSILLRSMSVSVGGQLSHIFYKRNRFIFYRHGLLKKIKIKNTRPETITKYKTALSNLISETNAL